MTKINSILLIEDDLFIGEMYSRSLSREGYQVDLIQNGQQGLQAALSKTYDLILLDVILPETKGTDILRGSNRTSLINTHVGQSGKRYR